MELRPLLASVAENPFSRRLGDLILSVATHQFDTDLFQIAQEATSCAHLLAYSIGPTADRQMIFAANVGSDPVARETGTEYVSRFWEADPANRICADIREEDGVLLARPSIDELRTAPFRRACHSAVGWSRSGVRMVDRVSIFRRRGNRTVKVSFHRDETAGRFGDREIDNIAAAADILTALMTRNKQTADTTVPDAGAGPRSCYVEKLRTSRPALTVREAEVCACIVHGMSSEGVALELGISVNTVRTFRKRAYARLNISSQNELIKIVLAGSH